MYAGWIKLHQQKVIVMPPITAQSKPQFISFEGTEGVGKSTLIANLADFFTQNGIEFIQTREPGGSEFAEKLRAMLLDPVNTMAEDSELLLMFAARADHLHQVILPALQQGKWVLCDRFTDSTIAYQGFGRQFGDNQALQKIQVLIDNFVPILPNLTIWLDLPVLEGMSRAKNRGKLDRFEQEKIAFFERVHQGFSCCYTMHPQRVVRIDASGSADEVLDRVLAQLNR